MTQFNLLCTGGVSPNPNPQPLPDYVDSSVADYIVSETGSMNAIWGPAENRGALAFMHIPPYVARTKCQGFTHLSPSPVIQFNLSRKH
jgi:hypothetical protein